MLTHYDTALLRHLPDGYRAPTQAERRAYRLHHAALAARLRIIHAALVRPFAGAGFFQRAISSCQENSRPEASDAW